MGPLRAHFLLCFTTRMTHSMALNYRPDLKLSFFSSFRQELQTRLTRLNVLERLSSFLLVHIHVFKTDADARVQLEIAFPVTVVTVQRVVFLFLYISRCRSSHNTAFSTFDHCC